MQQPVSNRSNGLLPLLAKRMANRRREAGLSQAQLAELLAIEPDTVSRMERGLAVPSLERLIRYADALNTTVNELLGEIPKTTSKAEQEWTSLLNELSAGDKQLVLALVKPLIRRFKAKV